MLPFGHGIDPFRIKKPKQTFTSNIFKMKKLKKQNKNTKKLTKKSDLNLSIYNHSYDGEMSDNNDLETSRTHQRRSITNNYNRIEFTNTTNSVDSKYSLSRNKRNKNKSSENLHEYTSYDKSRMKNYKSNSTSPIANFKFNKNNTNEFNINKRIIRVPLLKYRNIDNTLGGKFTNNFMNGLIQQKQLQIYSNNLQNSKSKIVIKDGLNNGSVFLTRDVESGADIISDNNNYTLPNIKNIKKSNSKKDLSHDPLFNVTMIEDFADYGNKHNYDHINHLKKKYITFRQLFKNRYEMKIDPWTRNLTNQMSRVSPQYGQNKMDSYRKFGDDMKTDIAFNKSDKYDSYKVKKVETSRNRLKLKPLKQQNTEGIEKLSNSIFELHKKYRENRYSNNKLV